MEEKKRLVIIDGHAMLYRAFYAFPQTLTTRKGELVNAVYGFTRSLLQVLPELEPTYLAVSFDVGKSFRHVEYPEYKAHREKMPDELKSQEKRVFEVVRTLNVPVFVKDGFEADDVIGTISRKAMKEKVETVIVTGDMDITQLIVDNQVLVYMPGRGGKDTVLYGEKELEARYGLKPRQIPDMKGLAGDSSDNIPGIRGIGEKTACGLLKVYDSVENLYTYLERRGDEAKRESEKEALLKPALLKKLTEGKESALESKRLATIVTDVPLELDLEACEIQKYDKPKAVALFKEMEFTSLISKLPNDVFEESVQEALF